MLNWPLGQAIHEVKPSRVKITSNVPVAAAKKPGKHAVQLDAPDDVDAVPKPQGVQPVEPLVDEYVPAEHKAHVNLENAPVATEKEPLLQGVHAASEEAPAVSKYVPGGHELQIDAPATAA